MTLFVLGAMTLLVPLMIAQVSMLNGDIAGTQQTKKDAAEQKTLDDDDEDAAAADDDDDAKRKKDPKAPKKKKVNLMTRAERGAGALVSEVVMGIRTVAAFNAEHVLLSGYVARVDTILGLLRHDAFARHLRSNPWLPARRP